MVAQLGLNSYGKRPLGSATEERMMPYYFFRLGFLTYRSVTGILETPPFPYIVGECEGFGWSMERHFDVILGMDILKQCKLIVDHNRWSIDF